MTSVIYQHSENLKPSKMKSSTFALIENYQNLVKSLNDNPDCHDDMTGWDQEVPLSTFCETKEQIKQERLEPPMFCQSSSYNYSSPNTTSHTNNRLPTYDNISKNSYISGSHGNIPLSVYQEAADEDMMPIVPSTKSIQPQTHFPFVPSSSSSSSVKQVQHSSTVSLSTSPAPSPLWSSSSSSLSSSYSSTSLSPAFRTLSMSQQQPSYSSQLLISSSSSPLSSSLSSLSSSPASIQSYPSYTSLISASTSSLSSSPLLSSSTPTNSFLGVAKAKTFVTERGGSGCTLLSGIPNFLSENSTEMVPSRNQEESLEYTDLDRLPELSFYDDLTGADRKPQLKSYQSMDESVPLEVMVNLMRDAIEYDRKELKVSSDPHSWNTLEVARWVKWVCQKNNVPDISIHLGVYNGATLCSWCSEPENFMQFGQTSGSAVFQELDLWKTANSYETSAPQSALQMPYMESPQAFLTPSTSPAPSNGSSHDSQHIFNMDNSEDEVFYSEHKRNIEKCKSKNTQNTTATTLTTNNTTGSLKRLPFKQMSGRGHKKAITLWQFLLKLLVGPEDNSDCIRWLNHETRIFKIEDSKKVATMWGKVKSRPAMNYDKLSRSVRQYYKKGIIKKPEQTKRLVYQFCPGIC